MKSLLVIFILAAASSAKAEWVNTYVKGNGTVVNGYIRSAPDSITTNNYGYQKNDTYKPTIQQPSNLFNSNGSFLKGRNFGE